MSAVQRDIFEHSDRIKTLCTSCIYGVVAQGVSSRDDTLYCSAIHSEIGPIKKCSEYKDKSKPSRYDFEEIAWVLETTDRKVVGFRPPRKRE